MCAIYYSALGNFSLESESCYLLLDWSLTCTVCMLNSSGFSALSMG